MTPTPSPAPRPARRGGAAAGCSPLPAAAKFSAVGKEVLHNGAHHADAVSPEAARAIAAALNDHDKFIRLHKAAGDYFHATTDRTSRLAAPAFRDALLFAPTPAPTETVEGERA